MEKFLILILFFYLLILVQTSFLIQFNILGQIPNLVLIAVLLFVFFENPRKNFSYFPAIFGGFFLDLWSNQFLGIFIISLILLTFLLKKAILILKELNIFWFLIFFIFSFIFFDFLSNFLFFLSKIPVFEISFFAEVPKISREFWSLPGELFLINLGYNLIFGLIFFYFGHFFRKYGQILKEQKNKAQIQRRY